MTLKEEAETDYYVQNAEQIIRKKLGYVSNKMHQQFKLEKIIEQSLEKHADFQLP